MLRLGQGRMRRGAETVPRLRLKEGRLVRPARFERATYRFVVEFKAKTRNLRRPQTT